MITEVSTPLRTPVPRPQLRIVSRTELSRTRGEKQTVGSKQDWQPVGDVVSGILRSLARPNEMPVMQPSKQSA
jgi:hypothetical protein